MKLTTTLKLLRDNKACVGGYNKVVRSLQGLPYNEDTDEDKYIKFRHKDEINLLSILDSNDVHDTLWALRATVQNSDRTARLIVVKCASEVRHLMTDPRSIAALDVAERYADGAATEEELTEARNAARDAARAAWAAWAAGSAARNASDAWAAVRAAAETAAETAAWAAGATARNASDAWAARAAAWAAGATAWNATRNATRNAAAKRQEEIIRSFLQEE